MAGTVRVGWVVNGKLTPKAIGKVNKPLSSPPTPYLFH